MVGFAAFDAAAEHHFSHGLLEPAQRRRRGAALGGFEVVHQW